MQWAAEKKIENIIDLMAGEWEIRNLSTVATKSDEILMITKSNIFNHKLGGGLWAVSNISVGSCNSSSNNIHSFDIIYFICYAFHFNWSLQVNEARHLAEPLLLPFARLWISNIFLISLTRSMFGSHAINRMIRADLKMIF